jgi:hypothetical protein
MESSFLEECRTVIDANIEPEYEAAKTALRSKLAGATYETQFRLCEGLCQSKLEYVKRKLIADGLRVTIERMAGEDYAFPGHSYLSVAVPERRQRVDRDYIDAFTK